MLFLLKNRRLIKNTLMVSRTHCIACFDRVWLGRIFIVHLHFIMFTEIFVLPIFVCSIASTANISMKLLKSVFPPNITVVQPQTACVRCCASHLRLD